MADGLDPGRVLEELRELQRLTGDDNGAQRVAWTDIWRRARNWLHQKLSELPVEIERDAAGNLWAVLPGRSAKSLIIGGHIDSVPNGGWLDGSLDVLAGLEVLRRIAAAGEPPVAVRLVDWADEEGARFGVSVLGSSAASGTLHAERLHPLRDRDGVPMPEALARYGVDVDRMHEATHELKNAAAYIELHIEQGPVLESLGLPLAVVVGSRGVERHLIRFTGQTSHSGATPLDGRHDAFVAACKLALAVREPARSAGGVATVGRVAVQPGIATAIPGFCEISLDQRHLDASLLEGMLEGAKINSFRFGSEEGVEVDWERIYSIEPVHFDDRLIELADQVIHDVAGRSHRMPSGPLHDATEMARAGIPTAMLFVRSLRGISHAKEEDSEPEDLERGVRALDLLATRVMGWIEAQK